MKQLVLDVAPSFVPSLDNYIPGPNGEVLAALRALLAGARRERFLYLFGPPGSGKTHLLKAAAACIHGARWFSSKDEVALSREPAPGCGLIAIDDVDVLTSQAQEDLFHLFNAVRTGNALLLVSAATAPGQLQLRADLATRLASTLAYALQPLSDADKAQALRQHAQQKGFALNEDVIDFLLKHWRRDLPSLMGALDQLDAYSLAAHRQISVPLLKQAIGIDKAGETKA
jgi:DnaA family protein